MEATKCAVCGHEGGVFHFIGNKYVCAHCFRTGGRYAAAVTRGNPTPLFPYTTNALTGHNVEVQSLPHLRRLEREHGVQNCAFNQNSSNFD